MLCRKQKVGDTLAIGPDIKITIVAVPRTGWVTLGIEAPQKRRVVSVKDKKEKQEE